MAVVFSHLELLLHEEALLTLMAFGQDLSKKVDALSDSHPDKQETPLRERRRSSNVSDVMEFVGKQAVKTGMYRIFCVGTRNYSSFKCGLYF